MFDRNSGLVQIWVKLIRNSQYTIDMIPDISNLREVVIEILNEEDN